MHVFKTDETQFECSIPLCSTKTTKRVQRTLFCCLHETYIGDRTRTGVKVQWTFTVRARPSRAQDGGGAGALPRNPPMLHQDNKEGQQALFCCLHETYIGGSNPNGREGPVDLHGPSTAEPRAGRRREGAPPRNPPMLHQEYSETSKRCLVFLLLETLRTKNGKPIKTHQT